MDIAGLSMNMSQISLQNKVDVSIMKMVMNDNKGISESINNMIDDIAVDENLGQNIDFRC